MRSRSNGRGGRRSLNFIRDISEQKRFEEQLAAAERLRSIGTLAGGIAHDFNNILMGIQGNASLLLLHLDPASPLRARLEDIEHCVESGAELSARILGFAQGGQYNPVPTDLNGLVQASLEMFSRTRKEIEVHAAFAGDLTTVEIDRAQFEQVLLNLFVNAWQAMPGGGELFVETRNAYFDEAQAAAAGIDPGRLCPGRGARHRDAASTPRSGSGSSSRFSRPRTGGGGRGSGLASAYGIVRGITAARSRWRASPRTVRPSRSRSRPPASRSWRRCRFPGTLSRAPGRCCSWMTNR